MNDILIWILIIGILIIACLSFFSVINAKNIKQAIIRKVKKTKLYFHKTKKLKAMTDDELEIYFSKILFVISILAISIILIIWFVFWCIRFGYTAAFSAVLPVAITSFQNIKNNQSNNKRDIEIINCKYEINKVTEILIKVEELHQSHLLLTEKVVGLRKEKTELTDEIQKLKNIS
ncbi:MAG: hypothetical protein REH79_00730 [Spiroplasma sp.]|nr:hypothetical protein [Spiroplasma sp.]